MRLWESRSGSVRPVVYPVTVGFENGKLVRVALRATASGFAERVSTFHYDLIDDAPLTGNDPQSLADAFRDDVIPAWKIWLDAAFTIQPVTVTEEIDPLNPTDPRAQWTSGVPTAGTYSGGDDLLPLGVAALAQLKTGLIGRRYNGRSWPIFVLHENSGGAGVLSTAAQAAFQTAMDAVPIQPDISPPASESTANLCVYSRTARALNEDPYAEHVTDVLLLQRTHYLRRREV
jgi:hypothetical protein